MIRSFSRAASKSCPGLRHPTGSLTAILEGSRSLLDVGASPSPRAFSSSLTATDVRFVDPTEAKRPMQEAMDGEDVSFERTAEQRRSAKLEYDRMQQVSNRILSGGDTDLREVQQVFNYWTSKKARLGGSAASAPRQVHEEYTESLLDFMLKKYSLQDIAELVKTNDSSCGGLINASHMFLIPFRGTHRSQYVAEQGKRLWGDAATYCAALCKSTKVQHMLEMAIADESCNIVADSYAQSTEMTLWMYRTWFLASFPNYVTSRNMKEVFGDVDPFDGAKTVLDCLRRMEDIYAERDLYDNSSGRNSLHATLISAWVHSELPQGLSEARKVLDVIETSDSSNDVINIIPYNSVLNGYAKLAKKTGRPDEALAFFEHIRNLSQKYPTLEPEEATYGTVLMAFANAGKPKEAFQFLKSMLDQAPQLVGTISCNIVLDAYSKHASDPRETESVFQWMASQSGLKMDRIGASSVLEAWGREACAQNSGERSERILLHCHKLAGSSEQYRELEPDVAMYNMVLNAWAGQIEKVARQEATSLEDLAKAAERADALLQEMQRSETMKPDSVSYNAVILAWAKSRCGSVAADRVLSLLDEMKESRQGVLAPSAFSYNSALQALVASEVPNGVQRAMDFLGVMERDGVQPDVITYNILLEGCVRRKMVEEAENLLYSMEKNGGADCPLPDEISYNIVLRAYSTKRGRDAPERAEEMLERMVNAGFPPSRVTYCILLDSFSRSGRPDAVDRSLEILETMKSTEDAKPSTVAYNTVLNTLAHSRLPDAPERAEMLLMEMQKEFEATGNRSIRPNSTSFSTVMNGWILSQKEGAAERAQALLESMEATGSAIKPNVITYATVLNAWSKSRRKDASDQALALLKRMERSGEDHMKPSAICYNSTMNAIAKSPHRPRKAVEARALLDRMKQSGTTPLSSSYSTVLNACAHCNRDETHQSFDIAKQTLLDYLGTKESTQKPNVIVFVNFLMCCIQLLPIGRYRNKMATATFIECDKQGIVNEKVIKKFKAAVASPVYRWQMNEREKRQQQQQLERKQAEQRSFEQRAVERSPVGTQATVASDSQV